MKVFQNPNKHRVPTLMETLQNIDKFKELKKEEDELQKQIDELEDKQAVISDEKNKIGKNILIYDVQIRYFDEYRCFSALDEAVNFKQNLVVAGIKESDIKIVLTNDWDVLEYIDNHKEPEESNEYDPEKLYKAYRQYKKSANKNWHYNDD